MKPYFKSIIFLLILTVLDFALRKGLIGHFLPIHLPGSISTLLYFTMFAIAAWFMTSWFCKRDNISLNDIGISFNSGNRNDFIYGFLTGFVLWAIVSLTQALSAGFSWQLRPEVRLFNLVYGLLFIFIADLGTELFTRGYPLTRFKESFGAHIAIAIMTIFVCLKSYSPTLNDDLLLYSMLIPALHTIFFSMIYFKTSRLGAALGVHTGANFVTISIFDLRVEQAGQAIPAGIFQPDISIEALSIHHLQLPWVVMAIFLSVVVYFWWIKDEHTSLTN